jgi:hypothetical protein
MNEPPQPGESTEQARQLCLSALDRARAEGSLDGVLRAVAAFAALADHDAGKPTVRLAPERVHELADRLDHPRFAMIKSTGDSADDER